MWVDAHAHIHDAKVARDDWAEAAREAGVARIITVGCDEATTLAAIAAKRPGPPDGASHLESGPEVLATAGLHPHDAKDGWTWLESILASGEVIAVGECGLDYHYDHSPRPIQQDAFEAQVAMALAHDLPLVIHTRNAWADTFAILDRVGVPKRTIFHCFTGGPAEAEQCLARETFLSYSGIVTFPSATDLQAAARLTPLERLLVETDSPYLAPVPHRGKTNRPAWVPFVGACIAELLGLDRAEIERSTWLATADAFRLAG